MTRPAIIITGGAKRVGAHLAEHFAQAGYDVALHYHRSAADAKKIKAKVEKHGVKCVLFYHDLSDASGISALMKKIRMDLPGCVALVNNASVFERCEFLDTDEALFDRQFDVNFKAPFFLTQAFAKTFGRGAVINILDTDIATNQISHFAYLLSKKTLKEFTEMAAKALGPNIRVNAVCPGCVLPSGQNEKGYEKKTAALIPMRKHPALSDIAGAVDFLISQPAITGQIIFVDGGKHVL